jgi:hypothetical protein
MFQSAATDDSMQQIATPEDESERNEEDSAATERLKQRQSQRTPERRDARELFNAWNDPAEGDPDELSGAEAWSEAESPEQALAEGEVAYNYDEWDRELTDHRLGWCRVVEKRVKQGDRVREGQLLGKVGNAGNSVGPHLHFHICNGPGPNSCDPVPHVYRSYSLSGYAHHGQGPWLKPDPAKRRRIDFKVPTDWAFMTFPSK